MARCARKICTGWRPGLLVRRGAGLQVDGDWYCSRACLHAALEERVTTALRAESSTHAAAPRVRLGSLLVSGDARLSPSTLAQALDAQKQSGRRLGAELRHMDAITSSSLRQALARQAHANFLSAIDPAVTRQGHGGLSRDMVQALGLVPFAADTERRILKVAFIPPLSHIALGALRALTGWSADPYLVDDELWPALLQGYATAREDPGACAQPVHSVDQALTRIVDAVEKSQHARLSQARLDTTLWLRIEAGDHVEDLLMPTAALSEEARWLTAPTLH